MDRTRRFSVNYGMSAPWLNESKSKRKRRQSTGGNEIRKKIKAETATGILYELPIEIKTEDANNNNDDFISLPLPRLRIKRMDTNIRFHFINSIAFSIAESKSKGDSEGTVTIKCLQGCYFEETFTSIVVLRTSLLHHFIKAHGFMKAWHGFCSSCSEYIKSTNSGATVEDEIDHLISSHIKVAKKDC